MATVTESRQHVDVALDVRPLRRVEYDRLVELGFFEDERLELLDGQLVRKMTQLPPHAGSIENLNMLLAPALVGRAKVRIQSPLAASDDSEPEPDVAVVAAADHRGAHPAAALLVIEVADSSLRYDLGRKAGIYAEAGIADYWVVDLRHRVLVVHREPASGRFGRVTTHRASEVVSPLAFPDVEVCVADVVG